MGQAASCPTPWYLLLHTSNPTIDQALHGSFILGVLSRKYLEAHGWSRLQTISHPSNDALWVPRDSANCILLRLRTTILLCGCLKEMQRYLIFVALDVFLMDYSQEGANLHNINDSF
ncbi:uncharacterized protein CIMG_12657 [Coccidioides immitis RS]|uniref:Uncharacterized protein n=1 Tax=Coccidioides immitis (strain RS) TaxID=246410 RepID=A0A0D8JRS0_COCIM|nr:uncharacterized protein CIMG_12657 [Coccidioides immitis RS]KJF59987.1 hypothetical protein CIMG_12657 [Coccidioides immitis RS]